MARKFHDFPQMREFLGDRVFHDPFVRQEYWEENPRSTALREMIERYPNHHHNLPLLRDRAKNDPDEEVRNFARRMLFQFSLKK